MSTRVALNLNLRAWPERLASGVRFVDDDVVSDIMIAQADLVYLKNVRPIIDRKILSGIQNRTERPQVCSFISGDLIAWEGSYTREATNNDRGLLEQHSLTNVFNGDEIKLRMLEVLRDEGSAPVGFSPFKMNVFYTFNQASKEPIAAFDGADELVAAYWSYTGAGAQLRAFERGDRPDNASQHASGERNALHQGFVDTDRLVAELIGA